MFLTGNGRATTTAEYLNHELEHKIQWYWYCERTDYWFAFYVYCWDELWSSESNECKNVYELQAEKRQDLQMLVET